MALTGTVTDPGSGVASLRFQYAARRHSTWTDICTVHAHALHLLVRHDGPADALYDMRTHATDNAGNTSASARGLSRRIDNTARR